MHKRTHCISDWKASCMTCLFNAYRSFTDLKRGHSLFSMSTSSHSNGFLIFWDETNKEMEAHIRDKKAEYRGRDYKPDMWHSVCTTWDSGSGLVQLWFDGRPSIRKFVTSGLSIRGSAMIIMIGQVQLHFNSNNNAVVNVVNAKKI